MNGTEDGIPDLTESSQIPVLQDTSEDQIVTCFGASKWYVYVVDRSGVAQYIHYQLDLDAERGRLLSEIALVSGESK